MALLINKRTKPNQCKGAYEPVLIAAGIMRLKTVHGKGTMLKMNNSSANNTQMINSTLTNDDTQFEYDGHGDINLQVSHDETAPIYDSYDAPDDYYEYYGDYYDYEAPGKIKNSDIIIDPF